jgi:hypothetical protein
LGIFYYQRKSIHNRKPGAQPKVMHLPLTSSDIVVLLQKL